MLVVYQACHMGKWKSDNRQFHDQVHFDAREKNSKYIGNISTQSLIEWVNMCEYKEHQQNIGA